MIVISRHVNESVVIGEDIVVTVLEVSDDHVRLGITSPHNNPPYWEHTLYLESAEEKYQELQLR